MKSLHVLFSSAALLAATFCAVGQTNFTHYTLGDAWVRGKVTAGQGFYGNAAGLSNASPSIATNGAAATNGSYLTKTGDALKFEDPWVLAIEEALNPKYIIVRDEFIGGGSSTDAIGDLGWRVISGSVGSIDTAWGTNRPGVRELRTGTTISNYYGISFHGFGWNQQPVFMPAMSNWVMRFEFRLPDALTNGQIVVGVGQNLSPPTYLQPQAAWYLWATNFGSPFYFVQHGGGGNYAVSNSTINVDTGWHILTIAQTNAPNDGNRTYFKLDDGPTIAIGAFSVPSGQSFGPYIAVTTGEAAAKKLWIDRWVFIGSAR
jgi:hypothetical protein